VRGRIVWQQVFQHDTEKYFFIVNFTVEKNLPGWRRESFPNQISREIRTGLNKKIPVAPEKFAFVAVHVSTVKLDELILLIIAPSAINL
jgi:hypothetical protein